MHVNSLYWIIKQDVRPTIRGKIFRRKPYIKYLSVLTYLMDLDRFGIKPSICEKSPRKPASTRNDDVEDEQQQLSNMKVDSAEAFTEKGKGELYSCISLCTTLK